MPDRARFITALETEHAAFEEFVGVLEAESAALAGNDIDALPALAHAKSDKVVQLSRLFEERRTFLRAAGFEADRTGMAQWMIAEGGADGARLSKLWSSLLERAAHAQKLNEANGALIETRLRFNQSALAALQAAAQNTAGYGPDGSTTLATGRSGRDFGTA